MNEPRASVLAADSSHDSVVPGGLGVEKGNAILVYVREEGYLIWDDRELYFRGGRAGQAVKLLDHMLKHKDHWQGWDQIGAALWPALMPDSAPHCVYNVARSVASKLAGTTARLEGRPGYGYRLTGEIEVI